MGRKDGLIISLAALFIVTVILLSPIDYSGVNSDIVGLAYEGFSDPINTYTFNSNTNTVSTSDSAVYRYGYYSVDGAPWQQFTLNGNILGGNWLTGTTTKTLPSFGPGEHYIVIYSCTRISGAWNCHENEWQIKILNNAATTPTATCNDRIQNQGETGIDCGGPCSICSTIPPSTGPIYYVSTNGIDGSNTATTAATAWKTLSYACSRVTTSGSIIHVNAGTYTESSTCNLAVGVSIEGDSKATSIIKSNVGSSAYAISLSSGSSNTQGNQHISNIRLESATAYSTLAAIRVINRGNVEIANVDIINFREYGIIMWNGESSTNFAKGNSIHGCTITNSGAYVGQYSSGDSRGSIDINSQDGLQIYDNTITVDRPNGDNGNCIDGVEGYIKNMKVYNNVLYKKHHPGKTWDFAIEIWDWLGGNEIYNNTITGSIDIVHAVKGSSTYSVWVHDNTIGQPTLMNTEDTRGFMLEESGTGERNHLDDITLERNHIKNVAAGINVNTADPGCYITNLRVSYNIFESIGMSGTDYKGWGVVSSFGGGHIASGGNVNIWNNVFKAADISATQMWGIDLFNVNGPVSIKNNIIIGFEYAPIYNSAGTSISSLTIQNNIFYNNGNSNTPRAISGGTISNNIVSNPLLTSEFHPQAGSPAINKGVNVGLTTDYAKKSLVGLPDIGAFETDISTTSTTTQPDINTPKGSGKTYYVSSSTGLDTYNGLSESTPWKSIYQVNKQTFQPGDTIVFKRGDTWREQLVPDSGSSSGRITYGSYGTGAKPKLLGSADCTGGWTNVGTNLWQNSNSELNVDVGNLIFNNEAGYGIKQLSSSTPTLDSQGEFWYDPSNYRVRLYSVGDPSTVYSHIECALKRNIIGPGAPSYIIIENLDLRYGAAHGIGFYSGTNQITVRNCDISYIGGGDFSDSTGYVRYGNGIEFWESASNIRVENCRIDNVYDAAITTQGQSGGRTLSNVFINNNTISNSEYSFEFWFRDSTSTVNNVFFENNTCTYAGGGFGHNQRPDMKNGRHLMIFSHPAQTTNVYIRYNTFYEATESLMWLTDLAQERNMVIDYNRLHQSSGYIGEANYGSNNKYSTLSSWQQASGKDAHSVMI